MSGIAIEAGQVWCQPVRNERFVPVSITGDHAYGWFTEVGFPSEDGRLSLCNMRTTKGSNAAWQLLLPADEAATFDPARIEEYFEESEKRFYS